MENILKIPSIKLFQRWYIYGRTNPKFMDDKFPIGKFNLEKEIQERSLSNWIDDIVILPKSLRAAISGLTDDQLNTTYREGGWTLRQVVHHIGDSHMNAIIRIKLALTEENPTIKPYKEQKWAELGDYESSPIDVSLNLIEAIHKKWAYLLWNLEEDDINRTFHHPEMNKDISIHDAVAMYAWHGNHHLAHITKTIQKHNW